MPTNVSEFDGVCYATSFYLQGNRVVVRGTYQSDRAGVRNWLAAAGYPRFRAYLTPLRGTTPGFYVKPYVTDVYYRIDPTTGAADWDGQTRFGDLRPVTESDGFRGAVQAADGTEPGPSLGSQTRYGRAVIRYTGVAFTVMATVIAMFAYTGFMLTHSRGLTTTFIMLVASCSAVAVLVVLIFGGRGYSRADDTTVPVPVG